MSKFTRVSRVLLNLDDVYFKVDRKRTIKILEEYLELIPREYITVPIKLESIQPIYSAHQDINPPEIPEGTTYFTLSGIKVIGVKPNSAGYMLLKGAHNELPLSHSTVSRALDMRSSSGVPHLKGLPHLVSWRWSTETPMYSNPLEDLRNESIIEEESLEDLFKRYSIDLSLLEESLTVVNVYNKHTGDKIDVGGIITYADMRDIIGYE